MIVGIDVGLTGAVAVLTDEGTAIEVFDLPTMLNGKKSAKVKQQLNAGQLARILINGRRDLGEPTLAFVEEQRAMPDQGVSSVFSIGFSYGSVCAVLATLGIGFLVIQPAQWKKYFCLAGADKDAARTLAIREFPLMADSLARKKDHNRAEALLLAKYGFWRHSPWSRGAVSANNAYTSDSVLMTELEVGR